MVKLILQYLAAVRRRIFGPPPAPTRACPHCWSTDIEWVPGEGWLCHNLHDVATRPRVHAELYPRREYSTS